MRAFIALASTIALAACNMAADAEPGSTGPGGTTQRSYDVGDFEGVVLAGSQDVVVKVGGATSVRAEGDADVIEKMEVTVENGRLRIGGRKGVNFRRNHGPVTVYVTTPRLSSATIAGSGDMQVDRAEGARFDGSIAGSGNLRIDALKVGESDFSIAGSGNIRAAGNSDRTKASIAGSGDVDIAGVEARQAEVSILGSGNVRAKATEAANISVMGSGDVTITGGARCTVKKGGSGEVRCG